MMTYDDLEEFIKKVVIYGNGRINKVVLDDECVFGALSKVTREEAICYGQSLVNSISINIPMLLNHYKNPNFDFKTDEDMKSHAAWIAIHELSHLDQKKDFIKMADPVYSREIELANDYNVLKFFREYKDDMEKYTGKMSNYHMDAMEASFNMMPKPIPEYVRYHNIDELIYDEVHFFAGDFYFFNVLLNPRNNPNVNLQVRKMNGEIYECVITRGARVVNPNEVLRFILKRTMLFDLNKLYVININKEEEIGVTKIILHETAIKDI